MKKDKIKNHRHYWTINDRYHIYKIDGCIYDTKFGKDIPQKYFKIKDKLLKK